MHWVREYALPIFAKELQFQYSPSFITVFLGANDAVLKDGPDKVVYVEICAFRQGYEPKLTKPLLAKNVHMVNKMNDKEGKIELSSKGIPINWNDENWEYYKALMVSCFEEKDLENIASGEKVLGDEADEKVRLEWKQKQAQIRRIILGSVSLALAQRVMKMSSGTEMWISLLEYYEAPSNQILAVHKQSQLLHKLVARRSTV
ncbi:hypothetical protein JM16_009733 [Phytophthora kernoviae]|uniref:SGNH hydrolase-type esterase domain-containing protein n=1 Tax=Phytophthora kernoviae TaxID=325452 RepID=A0A8T0LKI3_9STRA|nr:hypothetical protein JM16_009733 [Phytophthora kernoviae]